ncbi:hypothetical protein Bca4012_057724 [Brassica carinata]
MAHGGHRLALEKNERGMIQEVLVHQMASSLAKDSKFVVALAAATRSLWRGLEHEAFIECFCFGFSSIENRMAFSFLFFVNRMGFSTLSNFRCYLEKYEN